MALWNLSNLDDALWPVRALRATPPGQAGADRRANVFHAALEQFEELLRAAHATGPASSPILLFYALSQAGRAILAAHGADDSWDVSGHGLGVKPVREDIGATTITPKRDGLFQAVAATTGSDGLTKAVSLSEAWGASPRFLRAPGLGDQSPPLFRLTDDGGQQTVRSAIGGRIPFEEFWNRYRLYPGAENAVFDPAPPTSLTEDDAVVFKLVSFPDETTQRVFYDALVESVGQRYLRVPLGEARDQPSGLMTWWITLIALSSLARYEPAGWTAALAAQSALAVPIERTLRDVSLLLPGAVRDALAPGQGE